MEEVRRILKLQIGVEIRLLHQVVEEAQIKGVCIPRQLGSGTCVYQNKTSMITRGGTDLKIAQPTLRPTTLYYVTPNYTVPSHAQLH